MMKMTWENWQTLSRAVCTGTVALEAEMQEIKAQGKIPSDWQEERLKELEGARKILDEIVVQY
jgi:hypothetical protein